MSHILCPGANSRKIALAKPFRPVVPKLGSAVHEGTAKGFYRVATTPGNYYNAIYFLENTPGKVETPGKLLKVTLKIQFSCDSLAIHPASKHSRILESILLKIFLEQIPALTVYTCTSTHT